MAFRPVTPVVPAIATKSPALKPCDVAVTVAVVPSSVMLVTDTAEPTLAPSPATRKRGDSTK